MDGEACNFTYTFATTVVVSCLCRLYNGFMVFAAQQHDVETESNNNACNVQYNCAGDAKIEASSSQSPSSFSFDRCVNELVLGAVNS